MRLRISSLVVVFALAGAAESLAAAQAIDPFYADLLRGGTLALERGEHARAAEELRLACFGMLEQPNDLALCLVRLALAQARLGAKEDFLATFRRIEEVETRFGAYAAAPLDPAERSEFEAQAGAWVAPEVLKALPGFAPLVREREIAAVRALPANRRRAELERRLESEPGELAWKLMAAELELAEEKAAAAAGHLAGVDPGADGGRVACLRGTALALAGRCAEAVDDLARCAERGSTPERLDPDLACLVELERWDEARALVASAPPRVRDRSAVRRLERRIPEPVEESPAEATPAASENADVAAATSPEAAPAPPPSGPASLTGAQEAAVAEARQRLRSARTAADLDAALARLQPVIEARPDLGGLRLLAGELHYRASRWRPCAGEYRAAGEEGPDDPTQRFYMAVCLFEAGDREGARAIAASGLERLPRTPFVQSYLDRFAGE